MPEQKKYLDYTGLQELVVKVKGLLAEASVNITDTTNYKVSGIDDNLALPSQSQMEVLEVRGNSKVCSNLFNNTTDYTNPNANGVAITINDNSCKLNGTSTNGFYNDIATYTLQAGTYSYKQYVKSGGNVLLTKCRFGLRDINDQYIPLATESGTFTLTQTTSFVVVVWFGDGITFNNTELVFMLNKGSTALPYEPYFEGIKNSKNNLVNTGRNLWAGTSYQGSISGTDGSTMTSTTRCYTDYIEIKPNTEYCYTINPTYRDNNKSIYEIYYYDSDKNFISYNMNVNAVTYDTKTTPSNAKYIRVLLRFLSGGTTIPSDWTNVLCINVSDTSFNGTYEPYTAHTLTINETLRSAGSAYDKLDLVAKKKIVKVGRVDLGSLNYTLSGQLFIAQLTAKTGTNLLCTKYTAYALSGSGNDPDMCMYVYDNNLFITNSAYNDTTAFKTAMSGVYLNYELADYTETDIDLVNYLPVYMNGTEQQTGDVPYTLVRNYDISVKDQVITNVQVDARQEEEIDALKVNKADASDLSNYYTKSQADDKFKTKGGYHNYLRLIDTSTGNPLFVLYKELDQNIFAPTSWEAITKNDALSSLALMGETYNNCDYVIVDGNMRDLIHIDTTGNTDLFEVVYQGLIGVQYDASNSGAELTICFLDDTKNTSIDASTIGDDNTASYYFEAYSRQD